MNATDTRCKATDVRATCSDSRMQVLQPIENGQAWCGNCGQIVAVEEKSLSDDRPDLRSTIAVYAEHLDAILGNDGHDDRYQLADVIVHAIAYPDRDFSDLLDEYDLPQFEDVATFEDLRMHVSTAAEALRFDPTGDAPGVAVTLADGRKLRIRFDWI